MDIKNTNVHGSIFFLLQRYIQNNFPPGTWDELNKAASINHPNFELTQSYAITELGGILTAASKATGLSEEHLKESFGEYLVPDLLTMYSNYLNPAWKTFDVLLNTEWVMHGAVRSLNSTANPPVLNATRVNDKLIIIDYYSKRKMGSLAVGIIKGIAKYYHEEDKISVSPTSNTDDERVQIRVEFK